MGVENDAVARGHDIHDVAAERRNRVRRRRDRRDHPERRVFLERDAVIAAAPIRTNPFDARHQFDDLQLFDLVVQPPDFRFFQFELSPFHRVRFRQFF